MGVVGFVGVVILVVAHRMKEEGNDEFEQSLFGNQPVPWADIEKPQPKPNIDWAWSFPNLFYDAKHGMWAEYDDVRTQIVKACAVHITNNLDDSLGRGTEAKRLRAQAVWTYSHDAVGPRFTPVAWIGEELGQVELPVGLTKRILVATRDLSGAHWDGWSNSRLEKGQRIQLKSDMVPFSGTLVIKLIDSNDELLAETKWEWDEDPHTHWPLFRPHR